MPHRVRLTLPECCDAIARASTVDPIFPDEPAGSEATAAILVAIAWEASRFSPYTRQGPFLGLFRMRPPVNPPVTADMFLLPHPAALHAVDLARTSMAICASRERPTGEGLGLFRELGRSPGPADLRRMKPGPEALAWSRRAVALSRRLFRERLGPKEDESFVKGSFVYKWRGGAKQRDRERDLLGPSSVSVSR